MKFKEVYSLALFYLGLCDDGKMVRMIEWEVRLHASPSGDENEKLLWYLIRYKMKALII